MKYFYLLLALAGLVLPYTSIIAEYQSAGSFDFIKMFEAIYANNMTRIFAWDLAVSASTFMVFAIHYRSELRVWQLILSIAGIFLAGLSLGFPLFLFFREINKDKSGHRS